MAQFLDEHELNQTPPVKGLHSQVAIALVALWPQSNPACHVILAKWSASYEIRTHEISRLLSERLSRLGQGSC